MRARLLCVFWLAAIGCAPNVECTTEVTSGSGTWKGVAKGKEADRVTKLASVRDACRQMCAATKAESIDGCAGRCSADAEAGKIGARTTCGGAR